MKWGGRRRRERKADGREKLKRKWNGWRGKGMKEDKKNEEVEKEEERRHYTSRK